MNYTKSRKLSLMKLTQTAFLLLGLQYLSSAGAQSLVPDKIPRKALCSTGILSRFPQTFDIETNANNQNEVLTSLSRAVVSASSDQKVKVNFSALGYVSDPVNNPNDHRQIALKLKAANSCNVLYVIWPDEGGQIIVANKRNDGLDDTCGPNGYSLVSPAMTASVSPIEIGVNHSLQADYINQVLSVYADGVLAWQGTISSSQVPYDGPVGVRTDGLQFKFDLYTKLVSPLTSSNFNVPSHGSYPCLPSKPSIQYSQNGYIIEKGKAVGSSLVPINNAGPISSCDVSPSLPTGLSLNSLTCGISGTPAANQSSTNYTITATNSVGSYSKVLSIRVMTPPTITYSSTYYQLKTTASALITPTYAGNAVESCVSDKALPAGLALSNKCDISGTPSTLSPRTSYLITARNLIGTDTKQIDLEVIAPPVLIYASSSFTFKLADRVSISLRSNGGTGSSPTSCSIDKVLPSGVSFNTSSCTISGYANALLSPTTYRVTGTNAAGSGSTTFTLSVTP